MRGATTPFGARHLFSGSRGSVLDNVMILTLFDSSPSLLRVLHLAPRPLFFFVVQRHLSVRSPTLDRDGPDFLVSAPEESQ